MLAADTLMSFPAVKFDASIAASPFCDITSTTLTAFNVELFTDA